jgi:hypothetical protein
MPHIQPSLFDGAQALEDMQIGQAVKTITADRIKAMSVSINQGGEYINPNTGNIAIAVSCSFFGVTLKTVSSDVGLIPGREFIVDVATFTSQWREFGVPDCA